MQAHRVTYQDLTNHGISQEEVNLFIEGLSRNIENTIPVTVLDAVDDPIYGPDYRTAHTRKYYHTGLARAVIIGLNKMIKALLEAGANPDLTRQPNACHSPLLLAIRQPEIFNLFLAPTNPHKPDIYVCGAANLTLFSYSWRKTDFVRSLLNLDSELDDLSDEKKNEMSQVIAQAAGTRLGVSRAICATVGKVYQTKQKEELPIEKKANVEKLISSIFNSDLTTIVLSYMTFFKKKSPMLTAIEESVEQQKQQKTDSHGCAIS